MNDCTKILYIHGLGGGLQSATYAGLRRHFDGVDILLYPSQTATFGENLAIIKRGFSERVPDSYRGKVLIVGTSLGGFFATKLADFLASSGFDVSRLRLMLVNPAAVPYETAKLLDYPQELSSTYEGETILKNEGVKKVVVLTADDEVLDPSRARGLLEPADIRVFERGGHSCWNALELELVPIVRSLLN